MTQLRASYTKDTKVAQSTNISQLPAQKSQNITSAKEQQSLQANHNEKLKEQNSSISEYLHSHQNINNKNAKPLKRNQTGISKRYRTLDSAEQSASIDSINTMKNRQRPARSFSNRICLPYCSQQGRSQDINNSIQKNRRDKSSKYFKNDFYQSLEQSKEKNGCALIRLMKTQGENKQAPINQNANICQNLPESAKKQQTSFLNKLHEKRCKQIKEIYKPMKPIVLKKISRSKSLHVNSVKSSSCQTSCQNVSINQSRLQTQQLPKQSQTSNYSLKSIPSIQNAAKKTKQACSSLDINHQINLAKKTQQKQSKQNFPTQTTPSLQCQSNAKNPNCLSTGLKGKNPQNLNKNLEILKNHGYSPNLSHAKSTKINPQQSDKDKSKQASSTDQNESSQIKCKQREDQGSSKHKIEKKYQKNEDFLSYKPKLSILKDIFKSQKNFTIKKFDSGTFCGKLNQHGQPQGLGITFYNNGKLFEGEFKNGIRQGQGYQEYPDGSFFMGAFKNNKKNGKGRFQWNNGEIYDGEWKNNKKHGSGQWITKNEINYIGEWRQNKIEGFGVLLEANQRYEGQFRNFQKHGHGTYRYANNQVYTGQFQNNRLHGLGQYFWTNGDYYKGDFKNNKRHGNGYLKVKIQSSSQQQDNVDMLSQYKGQFKNDKKCGAGIQIFTTISSQKQKDDLDSIVYKGNFQNDLKHGWGSLIENRIQTYTGYWLNDKPIQTEESCQKKTLLKNQGISSVIQEQTDQMLRSYQQNSNQKIKPPLAASKNNRYDELKLPPKQPSKSKRRACCLNQQNTSATIEACSPNSKSQNKLLNNANKRTLLSTFLHPTSNARSRYMRRSNHYIEKSILPQRLSKEKILSLSPYRLSSSSKKLINLKEERNKNQDQSARQAKFKRPCKCQINQNQKRVK